MILGILIFAAGMIVGAFIEGCFTNAQDRRMTRKVLHDGFARLRSERKGVPAVLQMYRDERRARLANKSGQ